MKLGTKLKKGPLADFFDQGNVDGILKSMGLLIQPPIYLSKNKPDKIEQEIFYLFVENDNLYYTLMNEKGVLVEKQLEHSPEVRQIMKKIHLGLPLKENQKEFIIQTAIIAGDIQWNAKRMMLPQIPQEPVEKNQYTHDFERIVTIFANQINDSNPENHVKFWYDDTNQTYYCQINSEKRKNLTHILKRMQVGRVELSDDTKNALIAKKNEPMQYIYSEGTGYVLHPAEMSAIRDFTLDDYQYINAILDGDSPEEFLNSLQQGAGSDEMRKNASNIGYILLKSAYVMTAVNQMPDTEIEYAFRASDWKTEKREQRIDSITNPQNISWELGFLSASKDRLRYTGEDLILFYHVPGKDISRLSHFPLEKEFLIFPTQMKCLAHQEENGKHYYVMTSVSTTLGLTQKQTRKRISNEMWEDLSQAILNLSDIYEGNQAKAIEKLIKEVYTVDKKYEEPQEKYYKIMKKIDKMIIQNKDEQFILEVITPLKTISEENESKRREDLKHTERLARREKGLEKRGRLFTRKEAKRTLAIPLELQSHSTITTTTTTTQKKKPTG